MKKKNKKILGIVGGLLTLGLLTACNSFCSVKDNASYRYAYDPVNTEFFESEDEAANYIYDQIKSGDNTVYLSSNDEAITGVDFIKEYKVNTFNSNNEIVEENIIASASFFIDENSKLASLVSGKDTSMYFIRTTTLSTYTLNANDEKSTKSLILSKNSVVQTLDSYASTTGYNKPADQYWTDLDKKSIEFMASKAVETNFYSDKSYSSLYELFYGYTNEVYKDYQNNKTNEKLQILLNGGEYVSDSGTSTSVLGRNNSLFTQFGRYKFLESDTENELKMASGNYWENIENWNREIASSRNVSGYAMNSDYFSYYQTTLNSKVGSLKSCYAIDEGFYGHTSDNELNDTVIIGSKTSYRDAWKHGFLEGLLVYPISYMVEYFSHAFGMNGWGQIFAVLLVTLIVRGIFLLITFRSTLSQQKMQALQPEIAKLQQKYPNSNTNQYEKQRLAQAQMALYKKHKIHPFSSIIVLIIQFPLFIAVWNGMSGAASLSVDAVLGLRLSDTIWSVLANFSGWPNSAGWWTALVLILIMSGLQIVSMKLPQWLQKGNMKKVEKLGKSNAETDSQKQMKIVSWVMTIFIIIMGFTLPAAMGVYWLASALVSVLQTLIMHYVMKNKKTKEIK